MGLDIAHRQTGGIEPDDLVIDPVEPGLTLPHPLRFEAAVRVARRRQRLLAIRTLHSPGRGPVPAVGLSGRRLRACHIAKMRGPCGPEHALPSRTSGPSSARLRPAGLQAACSPSAAFSSSLEIVIVLASFPKHGPGQPYTEDLTLSSHAGACRLKASLAENRARLTDTPNVRLPAGPPHPARISPKVCAPPPRRGT